MWRTRQMSGRVEHVVSGQSAHFASLEELLAFIARVLATWAWLAMKRVKKAIEKTHQNLE